MTEILEIIIYGIWARDPIYCQYCQLCPLCYKMSDQVLKRTTLYALKIKKYQITMSISFSYQNSDCFSTCFSSYSSLFSFLVYFFVNTCKSCVRQVNIYGTVHQHNIHNTPLKVCDIGFFAIRIAEGNVVIDTKGKFLV